MTQKNSSTEAPKSGPVQIADLRDDRRARILSALAGKYRVVPVLVAILVMWLFFAVQNPMFLSPRNLTNLSVQIVVTAFLALGLVLILIVKEIDLSIAALSAVSAGTMAKLLVELRVPVVIALVAAIGVGMLVGFVQGTIVARFRAASFIVTLAISLALQGVLLALLPQSGSIALAGTPVQLIANSFLTPIVGFGLVLLGALAVLVLTLQSRSYQLKQGVESPLFGRVILPVLVVLAAGSIVVTVLNQDRGVPTPVAILVVFLAVMAYVTTQTRFGVYLYAIGGNIEASKRAAINVTRIKVSAFVLAGMFAAIGGIISASQTLGVSAQSGGGTLLLEAVAAAVIGGASLFGGRGSVWAALVGALLMGSIANGLSLLSASTEVKFIVQGLVLVAAVMIDSLLVAKDKRA
ncbi:sugar ABC transporter permease [Leucobacter sp. GX24907]